MVGTSNILEAILTFHHFYFTVGAIVSGLPFSLLAKNYSWGAVFFLLECLTGVTVLIMLLGSNVQPTFGKPAKSTKKLN